MADSKKKDPTFTSEAVSPAEFAEGTHPAVPLDEGADWAGDKKYEDNPDKPHSSTVAQVEVVDE